MSRWLQGILWIGGICIIWCPICVNLYGAGILTISISIIILILSSFGSGYLTWRLVDHILSKEVSLHPQLKSVFKYIFGLLWKEDSTNVDSSGSLSLVTGSHLEKEICLTSQTFHAHFILPWYSFISPDDKYSLQVKVILEDLLLNVIKTLHENVKPSLLIKSIISIYILHYRQFVRTLKKITDSSNVRLTDSMGCYQKNESLYKPLHPCLKSKCEVTSYCSKLMHILLQNYLPSEIVKCELLFVSLRDLIAQNVINSMLDQLCDTQWLNGFLSSCLDGDVLSSKNPDSVSSLETNVDANCSDNKEILNEAKVALSYLHSLSCIKEESSIDLQDFENISMDGIELTKREILDKIAESPVENGRDEVVPSVENKNIKTLDCAEDLLNYIKSSRVESKQVSQVEQTIDKSVTSALGTFISTTTVPLLPDRSGFAPLPLSLPFKMWESPIEEKKFLVDVKPVKKANPFKRSIVEGIKEEDYKMLFSNNKKLVSKDDSILELSQNGKSFWKFKCLKRFPTDRAFSKVQLPRSNSLDDIKGRSSKMDSEELSEKDSLSSSRLSFSSEGIECLVNWSSSVEEEERWKERGQLVKMSSFDRNDGIDTFPLETQISKDQSVSPPTGFEVPSGPTNTNLTYLSHVSASNDCDLEQNVLCESKELTKALSSTTSTPSSTSTLAVESAADAVSLEKALPNLESLPLKEEGKSSPLDSENPDLSPIYEESENLASTIAKLRSLLSEKETHHSLGSQSSFGSSESEPKSAQSDPGRCTFERSRFTFLHKDSSGSLASVKSTSSSESFGHCIIEEELMEASEVPLDGRIFTSISIPSTEVQSEHGSFHFTVYIIQYDAIYLCEPIQVNSEPNVQSTEQKMVLQTNFVKRRFREFLTLQSKFEDDLILRTAMKGIKGPNKWLNLPFSKLDSATISSRKQFLEKYLQAIIQRPELSISSPLKEFLAYGSDSAVSFVKKPLEINVPRLDKLFARTVSGVFHSIKTALPTFDSPETPSSGGSMAAASLHSSNSSTNETAGLKAAFSHGEKTKVSPSFISDTSFDVQLDITAEEEVCEMEESLLAIVSMSSFQNSPIEVAYEAEELNCTEMPSLRQHILDLKNSANASSSAAGDSSSSWPDVSLTFASHFDQANSNGSDSNEESYPFLRTLLDAFVEIICSTESAFNHQIFTEVLSAIMSQPASSQLEEKVNSFFCDENISKWFNEIRKGLLELNMKPKSSPPEERSSSKEELKASLSNCIPGAISLILGKELTQESLNLIIESIQHPLLMRDFGLHLLDLIFVQMLLPI